MRFLFTTIQGFETDFYGRVGDELERLGHDACHVTVSRRATRRMLEAGRQAICLEDVLADCGDVGAPLEEAATVARRYGIPSIRQLYAIDPSCRRRGEEECVRRAVLHFRALEQLFDRLRPDVLVPEVGCELPRTVAHRVALKRGVTTLFLFYTIFPHPLRLYADTMQAPIVPLADIRPLEPSEREEVEAFVRAFKACGEPIRKYRSLGVSRERVRRLAEYVSARVGEDAHNEYLRPGAWVLEHVTGTVRSFASRTLYQEPRPGRRFVYFPLHVIDDYKIKGIIPHCRDQGSLVEQVAEALPPGYDLVVKEHPLSIGQNPLGLLRRLRRLPNVRLVDPRTNTHALIEGADAVAVISSTVGLEALLYGKPVLTLGQPFYAGYGVTIDLDSFAEIRQSVPALLRFNPDQDVIDRFIHAAMHRCCAGAPVLVDDSSENARVLAASLEEAAAAHDPVGKRPEPVHRS